MVDEFTKQVADALVMRLTEEAAARGLEPLCVADSDSPRGVGDQPLMKISAGENSLMLWPAGNGSIEIEASVIPEMDLQRYDTARVRVPLSDAHGGLFIALLEGKCSVESRCFRRGQWLIVRGANSRHYLRVQRKLLAMPSGAAAETAVKRMSKTFVQALLMAASDLGLEVACSFRLDVGFGFEWVPRVDLSAGANTVTVWPYNVKWAWVQASVVPDATSRRVGTSEAEVLLDDAAFRLLVGLLRGDCRIVRRRCDAGEYLLVEQGKYQLWLKVAGHGRDVNASPVPTCLGS